MNAQLQPLEDAYFNHLHDVNVSLPNSSMPEKEMRKSGASANELELSQGFANVLFTFQIWKHA